MSLHDLKGIDLGQVGNNKYVNYTLEDFMADQELSRSGAERVLGQNKIRLSDLQPVNKPNNIFDSRKCGFKTKHKSSDFTEDKSKIGVSEKAQDIVKAEDSSKTETAKGK